MGVLATHIKGKLRESVKFICIMDSKIENVRVLLHTSSEAGFHSSRFGKWSTDSQ